MFTQLFHKFSRKPLQPEKVQRVTRPSITLEYDKSQAEKLKLNSLYLTVYEACRKECECYLEAGGPRGAIAMDILDVVEKFAADNPEIEVGLWAGVICVSLFPSLFAQSAGE